MEQNKLFIEDIYEAYRDAVRALGGPKVVGSWFWPERDPEKAAQLLNDCLNRDRKEKLDIEQLMLILKRAREIDCHIAMIFLTNDCGYETPKILNPETEKEKLQREVIAAAEIIDKASKRLHDLGLIPPQKFQVVE